MRTIVNPNAAINGSPVTLRDYAQLGLAQRLRELDAERERILILMAKPGTGHSEKRPEKIRQMLRQHWSQTPAGRKKMADIARNKASGHKGVQKGHKYKKGTHWMQRPENRAKMMARVRELHKARSAQAQKG
jgi:hypothetical protein